MILRMRLRELLAARRVSPYRLAQLSDNRITLSTAFRIMRYDGRLHKFDAAVCAALCEVLRVGPGELFVLEPGPRAAPRPVRRSAGKKGPKALAGKRS